ncbi:serine/threonine protein kinase [Candidatus Bipolaricaulota bacterium]|nr:serine/threonine protein kinase [Candidatus Bipolaricaulota bacterium]
MQNKPEAAALAQAIPEAKNVKFLAEGGFKAVYEAEICGIKEALKAIFIPEEADQPEARAEIGKRVMREIESLRALTSPYVVKLGSLSPRACKLGSHEYLVYSEEFLDGPTLRDRLRSGYQPSFAECQALLRCLFQLVAELKASDLIHRDIKPGNIVEVGSDERPFVVLDLGVAFKLYSTPITLNPEMRQGTLPYMAPEMFQPHFREMLDYRSDLYSAAVTVYEYAAGTHPIARRGEDDFTTMYRIARMKPAPLAQHRSDLPASFCQIVDQMIRKKPALRPSNIGALLKQLEVVA